MSSPSCNKSTILKKIEIQFIIESPYWMLCSQYSTGFQYPFFLLVAIFLIKVNNFIQSCSINTFRAIWKIVWICKIKSMWFFAVNFDGQYWIFKDVNYKTYPRARSKFCFKIIPGQFGFSLLFNDSVKVSSGLKRIQIESMIHTKEMNE